MQNLRIIQEEAVGIIKINENCQYNRVNADKVVVSENITVRIFGTVNTIILNKGAKLFLHGMLRGNVENKGGEIYIY
jgi:hypothetical protein